MGGVEILSIPKGTQNRGGHNGRGQSRETPPSSQAVAQFICGYCSKPYHIENECWKKSEKCLYCSSVEHQLSRCPSVPTGGVSTQRSEKLASKQSSAGGSRPQVPARIYALDYRQVSDSANVVEGMVLVFHCLTKVLSDPSTTHSFANPRFKNGVEVRLD